MSNNQGIFFGGMGSDIFGETFTGQMEVNDPVNDYLRNKYLREYMHWQR